MNFMNQAHKEFSYSLFEEFMEDASFLYTQRLYRRSEPEFEWPDVRGFEERLDAHIRALIKGGEAALEFCKEQALVGDFDVVHVALRIFCRSGRDDLIVELLDQIDVSDEEIQKAASDALCHALPRKLHEAILRPLLEKGPKWASVAARVVAHQGSGFGAELNNALNKDEDRDATIDILHALGCSSGPLDTLKIEPFLKHEDSMVSRTAGIALLRQYLRDSSLEISELSLPHIPLALSGSKAIDDDLFSGQGGEKALALGISGDVRAIPTLIDILNDTEAAENAALALNLITDAELYEKHFVPEEIDPDTLFPDELELYEKEELYAPGEEPGETIVRLTQKQQHWRTWWNENQNRFDPSQRYRNGKPFAPECLIENIRSISAHPTIRELAYKELMIRYGIMVPFNLEMNVDEQLKAISEMEIRITEIKEPQLQEGVPRNSG